MEILKTWKLEGEPFKRTVRHALVKIQGASEQRAKPRIATKPGALKSVNYISTLCMGSRWFGGCGRKQDDHEMQDKEKITSVAALEKV